MLFVAVLTLALLLHLFLGWQWTLLAGAVYGFFGRKGAWLLAALAAGLSWALLVLGSFVSAPAETGIMTRTMSTLLGNQPPWFYVGASVVLGSVLGLLGGIVGIQVRKLVRRETKRSAPAGSMPDLSFLKSIRPDE